MVEAVEPLVTDLTNLPSYLSASRAGGAGSDQSRVLLLQRFAEVCHGSRRPCSIVWWAQQHGNSLRRIQSSSQFDEGELVIGEQVLLAVTSC